MDTATHMLRTGRRGALFEYQMAFRDLRASVERIDLAWSLAWHDVVSRYRGSILGPLWITLSMGLMVLGIGVLGLVALRRFGLGAMESVLRLLSTEGGRVLMLPPQSSAEVLAVVREDLHVVAGTRTSNVSQSLVDQSASPAV